MLKDIKNILILVLVLIIILMRTCTSPTPTKPRTETKIETEYIQVTEIIPEYIPKWREKIIIQIDSFEKPIDTAAILVDFYSKYIYKDTLNIDTFGFVIVQDTVSQNQIMSRQINFNINIPETTIKETIILNEREWYIGPGVQGNRHQLNYVGGELYLKTKTSHLYGIGVGINNNLQPILRGGMYWRINK